jgi:hypothetical protein
LSKPVLTRSNPAVIGSSDIIAPILAE